MHLMRIAVCLLAFALVPVVGHAGQARPPGGAGPAASQDNNPPPPVAPAVINRDAAGHATIRAVRISTPLKIDGHLDETVYTEVSPMSDFIQNDPKEGAPATEKTEVWVLFDKDNLYVVARCWESHPESLVANEMRRDNVNIVTNDQFAFGIDTFHDRRNMLFFEISAAGGRIDGQVTNERQVALDWNPIWAVKTSRFDHGYVVEAALPFKSLRYKPGQTQIWGMQMRRHNMVKNEYSYLTPIPASVGSQGHFRAAMAATLVGLEVPGGGKNLDIKPYMRANVTTDETVRPVVTNHPGGDVGGDLKYGVTQSLAADVTVNTDFAQVEADEQQVNLTRFSLFFPEKRDFFLENAGIFAFGGNSPAAGAAGDAPLLFYSRNIGLSQGLEVPIRAGGRLSGRSGRYTIGVLNVESGNEPITLTRPTNFSVVRVKRDILKRSSVGMMFTDRTVGVTGVGTNQGYGVDGSFSFGPDLAINTYWARSKSDGITSDDASYRAMADYESDRYGAQFDHLVVGAGFRPDIGFVRRHDMHKELGFLRFSPRPKKSKLVRKYLMSGTFNHIQNGSGHLETRIALGHFEAQLQNTDLFFVENNNEHEFLPVPFRIATGVTLPVAAYDFHSGKAGYTFGRQRNLSGTVTFEQGTFYDGHKTTFGATSNRLNLGPQLTIEPGYTINKVTVVEGAFTQRLITTRTTYTMTPLMFASALVQYNEASNSLAVNARFRWEYQPGSELFVVYNETRDTLAPSFPGLQNRSFIVKINHVFRF